MCLSDASQLREDLRALLESKFHDLNNEQSFCRFMFAAKSLYFGGHWKILDHRPQ